MPHVGKRHELDQTLLQQITEDMLRAATNKPIGLVAQAGMDIALSLWAAGGTTRDMALQVATAQIDSLFHERSN